MKTLIRTFIATAVLAITLLALPVTAGIVVYEKDDKKVEIGGRIQFQYLNTNPDVGASTDEFFFRRLRPYIEGTVTKNWLAKFQFDLGKAEDGDEVAVKDAYMQYLGWANHTVTIGNAKTPFSREFLASSKRQQLVERSFSGDHNYGSPDRQLGVRLDGSARDKKITYAFAVGSEDLDPDVRKLDFDSPANTSSDWNQGIVIAGRADFHPLGYMAFDQADFRSDTWKYNISVALFHWSNDNDNNTYTDPVTGLTTSTSRVDLDNADGIELSAGLRGMGFSADIELHRISAETVDPTFTGGVYLNGMTDLDIVSFEAGYMLGDVEIVAGWDSLDADNYATSTDRTSVGLNWYLHKHNTKLQTTYRMTKDADGIPGNDLDEAFAQFQFVF